MSWTYRIMRTETGDKDEPYIFDIHEVYSFRNDSGRMVHPWTTHAMEPHGATLDELRKDFTHMKLAFNNPVLDFKTGKLIKE